MKENKLYVYAVVNKVSGEKYVGLSKDVDKRFKSHIRDAKLERYENRKISKNIREYGRENFEVIVLEETSDKSREKYWIEKLDTFNNGLNGTLDGNGNKLPIGNKIGKKNITRDMEEKAIFYYKKENNLRRASHLSGYPSRKIKSFLINSGVYKKNITIRKITKPKKGKFDAKVIGDVVEAYSKLGHLYKTALHCNLSIKNVVKILDDQNIDRIKGKYDRKKSIKILNDKRLQRPFYRITKNGNKKLYENIRMYRKKTKKTVHSPYLCLIKGYKSHNGYKFEWKL